MGRDAILDPSVEIIQDKRERRIVYKSQLNRLQLRLSVKTVTTNRHSDSREQLIGNKAKDVPATSRRRG